jgi:hypothetical protein
MDSQIFKEHFQGWKLIELIFFYTIENLLKLRCFKWARKTHLSTW